MAVGKQWERASLEDLRTMVAAFADERDWNQFHTPRNLGEVGELAEIFQWKGEVAPGVPEFTPEERTHLGEELSDVLLYLIRISDRCGVDLAQAARDKMVKNRAKYPAEDCRGKSDKYTAYTAAASPEPAPLSASASKRSRRRRNKKAGGDQTPATPVTTPDTPVTAPDIAASEAAEVEVSAVVAAAVAVGSCAVAYYGMSFLITFLW